MIIFLLNKIITTNNLRGKLSDAHTLISVMSTDNNYLPYYLYMASRFKTTASYHSYLSKQIKKLALTMEPEKIYTKNIYGNCTPNASYHF